jgi:voltage-gated potassium channel
MKEFFTNTFFTAVIAISATLMVAFYFLRWHRRLWAEIKRRYMEKKIQSLTNHFIVCGFGRVGSQVAEELYHEGVPFVVTEKEPSRVKQCLRKGWFCLLGDAAKEEKVLQKAGIERAKGLIITFGDDAEVLFVAVTAKAINPKLFIVARASSVEGASKLEQVGVDRIALPYKIGGYHMANMALRPGVVDFLDVIVDTRRKEMVVEELEINQKSPLVGQSLTHFGQKSGNVVVLAIKREDGSCLINPTSDIILKEGDRLILLGAEQELNEIRRRYGV